ncbi:MAG TPA: hypothetical protein VG095_09365 [Chthoniobacterales bacterium]|nr:hypothetical protein [Chthoniobacterales bacterium]
MNDFSDIEAELKQLRPAATSPELMKRVERALQERVSNVPSAGVLPRPKVKLNWFALGGLSIGAAAAIFLVFARVDLGRTTARKPVQVATTSPVPAETLVAQPQRTLVPEGVTRVVYNTRDEGLIFPEASDQPIRRVRSRARETVAFRDRSSGATLRVSYPTEDVRFIPVSGQ